jgi:hypothetical protein
MLGVWDAVDGVIALGMRILMIMKVILNLDYIHFGDTIKDVENKLYEKDLILQYKKIKPWKITK